MGSGHRILVVPRSSGSAERSMVSYGNRQGDRKADQCMENLCFGSWRSVQEGNENPVGRHRGVYFSRRRYPFCRKKVVSLIGSSLANK